MAITERSKIILPQDRKIEAGFIAKEAAEILPLELPSPKPVAQEPYRTMQWRILYDALSNRNNLREYVSEKIQHPFAQGLSRGKLLIEYTTVKLAREFALQEQLQYRSSNLREKLDFYIHDAGMEFPRIAVQRWTTNNDAIIPYYRGQTADLHRGGTLEELFAQDLHRTGDTHSASRQLAGHVCSAERSEIPAISMTGAHVLTAVGIGTALNDRKKPHLQHVQFSRFVDTDGFEPISVTELGEATFAQGEVHEAISQAVKDKSAVVFVGYNNLAGISMGLADTSVGNDPIIYARPYQAHGLFIAEASATDLLKTVDAAQKAVEYTRKFRKPSLLLFNNIYRVTDHTSSSMQAWHTSPDELERRRKLDCLPKYRNLLIEMGIVTKEEMDTIDELAKRRVRDAAQRVIKRQMENPENLYKHTYSPEFKYGPLKISEFSYVSPVDHLQGTRTNNVQYTDKKRAGPSINGRMYINTVIAQEMKRDPRIVIYGEDVAMTTRDDWDNLPDYFRQRIHQKREGLTPQEIDRARETLELVRKGEGYLADPDAIALFAQIMDGKGGVFKNTQFLDWLYGQDRVFNFPIREASIVGTAIGRAIAGQVPIVEIQFDSYTSPAFQQIYDQLSTLRWRSNGQFAAGMVIRIQGMNRVGGDGIAKAGGIGGIGHGAADVNRFMTPGLRHFIPGDVEDMGAGLREAIRVARQYQEPVLVYEAINLYSDKGIYQGPNSHIPLGEAEVVRSGNDILIITWSNNVRIAKKVSEKLATEGISVGVVNARGLENQFDWHTVIPEIKKANKVIVFEAGRGNDSEPLAAKITTQLWNDLDGLVLPVYARNIPMPAGEENEQFVVPQYNDLLEKTRSLARH